MTMPRISNSVGTSSLRMREANVFRSNGRFMRCVECCWIWSEPVFDDEMRAVFNSDEVPRELSRTNVYGDDSSHYYGDESVVDRLLDRREHLSSTVPPQFEITDQTVSQLEF